MTEFWGVPESFTVLFKITCRLKAILGLPFFDCEFSFPVNVLPDCKARFFWSFKLIDLVLIYRFPNALNRTRTNLFSPIACRSQKCITLCTACENVFATGFFDFGAIQIRSSAKIVSWSRLLTYVLFWFQCADDFQRLDCYWLPAFIENLSKTEIRIQF